MTSPGQIVKAGPDRFIVRWLWCVRKGKDGAKVNQVPLLEECERSGTVDGKEYIDTSVWGTLGCL